MTIRELLIHGLTVNKIESDHATENVSAMKQLAALSAEQVFGNSLDCQK